MSVEDDHKVFSESKELLNEIRDWAEHYLQWKHWREMTLKFNRLELDKFTTKALFKIGEFWGSTSGICTLPKFPPKKLEFCTKTSTTTIVGCIWKKTLHSWIMKSQEIFSLMLIVFVPSFMHNTIVFIISVLCVVLDWMEINSAIVADLFDFLAHPLNLVVWAAISFTSLKFVQTTFWIDICLAAV